MSLNKILSPSPEAAVIEQLEWQQRPLYIKRDDRISHYFSGNKYRKLFYYYQLNPFPYRGIVSYGGAQSNAMLSMAALARLKEVPFTYYMRYLPDAVKYSREGNFAIARSLGMKFEIISDAEHDEALKSRVKDLLDEQTLLIPQGGATLEARTGIQQLASEIVSWYESRSIKKLAVITPSGTGTTALWLQDILSPHAIEVVTSPVVGNSTYLIEQMRRLQSGGRLPTLLTTQKRYKFARPYQELYEHYSTLLKQGVEIDLVYAPVMLQALKEHLTQYKETTLLYVHSGGILGNATQLQRYQAKKLIP